MNNVNAPKTAFAAAAAAMLLISAGCGEDGVSRYHVSGTVTYNGKPIPAGVIQFDPDTSKGGNGPQGFAQISDGQYDTSETDMSPVGGPHIVRIAGYDGNAAPELPYGKPLFPEHREPVDLPQEATTVDFTVPATAAVTP